MYFNTTRVPSEVNTDKQNKTNEKQKSSKTQYNGQHQHLQKQDLSQKNVR